MPKFNLELFKTLILNFAYIHSKRRKLGMFIFFQKYQFVYRNKLNSRPIRQFPSFSIFGHGHVTWPEHLKIYFWGKVHFVARSPSERCCQLFICLEYIFDPGLEPLEKYSFYPRTITEWNKLPRKIELSNSLAAFKNAISNIY